ncbi:hypothetical protein [Aureliella helgolandensis]|uniref:Uncharacterized protein n=1 Tax=Aureliella helgolandensis TaxID=2527968 RepID=A0A518FZX0_9BACT|nr:hypothetical protein [Aureliella helgolandensis]QDV21893.1 hypothetical protein Q31a_01720 [Aureliella helgolandensis]
MFTIHFAIASIPIAVYLMMIGGLRMRSRPMVTTGWRDTLTLGIAVCGLVIIGPMQLFFPAQAAMRWHGWVWFMMLGLYILGLVMFLLSCRPRLISYGMNHQQFRDTLESAAKQVDSDATWLGEVLTLPNSNIQLASEPAGSGRVHQVVHVGLLDNLQDWLKLERAFVSAGTAVVCPRSAAGFPFVLAGMLLLLSAVFPLLSDPTTAHAQLIEFLNR